MPWMLLAQQGVDFTGAGGWASFGAVGTVLGWLLLVYMPRQEKRSDDKEASFFVRLADKDKAHKEELEQASSVFKASMDLVVTHCREELGEVVDKLVSRVMEELRKK